MSESPKRIGLMVGAEMSWPQAFIDEVNSRDTSVTAELVTLAGTRPGTPIPYSVIIDRISHVTPYYHVYLKYASLQGAYVINNPFTWSADDKFFGMALANRLGIAAPRSIVLPNKHVPDQTTPECFRNLEYPLEWDKLIGEVGVPAILKDVMTGGRRASYWVNTVDDLIQCYDESDTATMLLQQQIDSDRHVHCFVVGQQEVLALAYSPTERRYLADPPFRDESVADKVTAAARAICQAYAYDINMVEFVLDGETPYLINPTNPTPDMNELIMNSDQFEWCVEKMADMAIRYAENPPPRHVHFPWAPAA